MSYYAVKKGNIVGVFDNWADCQKATQGFPNADFKKFLTKEEADAYIADFDINLESIKKHIESGYLVAFTDGSFDKDSKQYSYGVVIIDSELKEHHLSGCYSNELYSDSANIAGEVFAVFNAMDWAVSNGYEKLMILHDLEGISKWATGEWKANTRITQTYVSIFQNRYSDILEVSFEHVKGHSNNRFNDKADDLANNAIANRTRIKITGDNWFTVHPVKNEDLKTVLDLLKEEEKTISIKKSVTPSKIIHKLALNQDRITITTYLTGQNTLLVQGKLSLLFQVVTTYIQDLLDNGNITAMLSSAYRMSIDKQAVDTQVQTYFTEYPSDYPENLKKLIKQSAINLLYKIDSEDYGQYVYPALRALEGHLKYLLSKGGITVASGSGFSCFNKLPTGWKLTTPTTLSKDKVKSVERIYGFYHNNRHSLFHFGDIIGSIDTTRTLSTRTDADNIIHDCLKMIKEST